MYWPTFSAVRPKASTSTKVTSSFFSPASIRPDAIDRQADLAMAVPLGV